jgi:mRNA interferase MazF
MWVGKSFVISVNPGDIILTDLDPVLGSEQAGKRPVLVISTKKLSLISNKCIICPITSNISPYPTKLFLPETLKTKGALLVDQVRAIFWQKRSIRKIETVSDNFLLEARFLITTIILDVSEEALKEFIYEQVETP